VFVIVNIEKKKNKTVLTTLLIVVVVVEKIVVLHKKPRNIISPSVFDEKINLKNENEV
jgi:hypothetical protein